MDATFVLNLPQAPLVGYPGFGGIANTALVDDWREIVMKRWNEK